MACATHFFFARRVRIITGSDWLAGLICFFGVGTLGKPSYILPADFTL